ncbi:ABC transporter substrate-binding protein [Paracraurococcus lichenis]|uniref:ABC transporter substrate-binding protein n=1 Tax=Paracraurococcus lichenis TaxID=3064888 RepID=A0ABT9EBG2_9PROT|nr:ABC transporter substrate-binding protein [Paracraurococcus sp. LOR1-02]MDO9713444.1 ABC transporter substrate-binding protein [Paracraurococcus sp. LOR1-02]
MRRAAAFLALALLPLAAGAEPPEGRRLYHGFTPFAAGREATATRLPLAYAACGNCHGPLAEGRREGGVTAPPITWAALARPAGEAPAYASAEAVGRAILAGQGRGGRVLDRAMPRYRLEPAELQALLDHLRRVGTAADLPPGVTADSVALGAVLPLSGPGGASGRAVLAGLREVLDATSAAGGVHGRRLLLVVADGARGTETALRDVLARPVYALVGGFWPGNPAAEAMLEAARVPHIGSLVLRAGAQETGPWSADLLAPVAEQQVALAGALTSCEAAGPRLGLRLAAPSADERDGAIQWFGESAALAAALREAGAPGCLGLGLAGLAALGGHIPPGWQARLVLPFPVVLLSQDPRGGPWRQLGRAAGRLAVEWLSRAGAVLHEGALPAQRAASQGYAPLPGAPVQFRRHRRHAWDAEVIEIGDAPRAAASTDRGG